jgi:hypothetical protein
MSRSGFLVPGFVGRSTIRKLIPLVISEKSEGFVGLPFAGQNVFGWPSYRTRTATRMNVDDGIRGRMARAPAIFAKGHVVAPAQIIYLKVLGNAGTVQWNLQKTTSPIRLTGH